MSSDSQRKDLTRSTWAIKARKALSVASDLAEDVMRLRDKPGVRDYLALGSRVAQKIVNKLEQEMYDFFDEWYEISDIAFVDEIMSTLDKFDTERVGGSDDYAIMITKVYGEEIGWVRTLPSSEAARNTSTGTVTYYGPYIHFDRYEETFNAIGRMLWEHLDTSKVVLTATSQMMYNASKTKVTLRPDFDINKNVHSSTRGIELYEKLKLYYDNEKNHSMILLGPPGTGKTTMMKYIANQFDKHTMRINVSELADISTRTVVAAVQLMKPEVLLIDDFDRFSRNQDSIILTQLEQVNKATRIFIVSMNDISQIDPAIIRPERFDEIIEISQIDDEVLNTLLGDVPDDIKELMRTWPVAYINEFSKRYKVLGPKQALEEMIKLRHRIQTINNAQYTHFMPESDEAETILDGDITQEQLDKLFDELRGQI